MAKDNKILTISNEIVSLSKTTILLKMRYLDLAIGSVRYLPTLEVKKACIYGDKIVYNPVYVIELYKHAKEYNNRLILHMLMHGIFKHFYVGATINRRIWNIACDIAVENSINELAEDFLNIDLVVEQNKYISYLKQNIKYITAEIIYSFIMKQNYSDNKLSALENVFSIDSHELWYPELKASSTTAMQNQSKKQQNNQKTNMQNNMQNNLRTNMQGIQQGNQQPSDQSGAQQGSQEGGQGNQQDNEGSGQKPNQSSDQNKKSHGTSAGSSEAETNFESSNADQNSTDKNPFVDDNNQQSNNSSDDDSNEKQDSDATRHEDERIKQMWDDISTKIQMDLESFSKQQGNSAGSMMTNLKEVNRERYDYTEFLKKFAVKEEHMAINMDEFDYVFYTYGLKLYKKMPLIEPLEYKDVKVVKEFVIAIDTSGSTSGELVNKFITKTYNILKSQETFARKINIHIIQCDTTIQEDFKLEKITDFDTYIQNMTIKGMGGTDFRPVFNYVNSLVAKKELRDLKGLIYFTDGWGDFPTKKPPYTTAFVFIDNDYNNYDVPPWAIKLILKNDEI